MYFSDPVPDLQRLGYTEREAAFLAVAARSSGYFVARQYAQFLNRKIGGITQQLIEKAVARGHVEVEVHDGWRRLCHINSRTIYRLVGDESSQNRRFKGPAETTTKLMILDYVLERPDERTGFVCSPEEKVWLFRDWMGIGETCFPRGPRRGQSESAMKRDRLFPDRFPIFRPKARNRDGRVQFTYFDPGSASVSAFERYLETHQPLFDVLRDFELIYAGLSERNFRAAATGFQSGLPGAKAANELLPRGREHFFRFMEVQLLWDNRDSRFQPGDLAVLREGERLYNRPEHERLLTAWRLSPADFEDELMKICGCYRLPGQLVFHLLRQNYPLQTLRRRGAGETRRQFDEYSAAPSASL